MSIRDIPDLERRIRRLEMEADQRRHKLVVPERTVKTSLPTREGGVTDHGALTGLGDNDHPQYLLAASGKAADSDKLDGIDSTGFVQTSGNQTVDGIKTFTSIPALPSTNPTTANQAVRKGFADATYLGISAKAADSDKLDGLDSTDFGRPVFLANPLTSNSFNNNSFSTTAKTKISLNTLYGVPAGAKAVMVKIRATDSGSLSNLYLYAGVGANNVADNLSVTVRPSGLPSNYYSEASGICACDANGDIYFQCQASGTDTMAVRIQIYGYWL